MDLSKESVPKRREIGRHASTYSKPVKVRRRSRLGRIWDGFCEVVEACLDFGIDVLLLPFRIIWWCLRALGKGLEALGSIFD
jgi:hypothetical protein